MAFQVKTYFAPAERASAIEIQAALQSIAGNTVIDCLMRTVSGLIAVLNEQRQILALNESFLRTLGIKAAGEVLGLRLGEALKCVHVHAAPGGCGTGEACLSCGAAIAMVTSLAEDASAEETCVLSAQRNECNEDLVLRVRCAPLTMNGKKLLLLFIQDITRQQMWASLEQVFFHDLANTVQCLIASSDALGGSAADDAPLIKNIRQLSNHLGQELSVQRMLHHIGAGAGRTLPQAISLPQLLGDLYAVYSVHPKARGKTLRLPATLPDLTFSTDPFLINRVLGNMLLNALEATKPGAEIRLNAEVAKDELTFSVWNPQPIRPEHARRIFQRNFSTKGGLGRGLGTYAMKLFGEQVLGGRVDFSSSPEQGTTFRFALPLMPD